MKHFLKLRILRDGKEQAVHYFVPKTVARAKEADGYDVAANLTDGHYSFSLTKDRRILGEWSNSIAPKQTVAIKDGEFTLEFSLLPALLGKGKVKAYLKNRPSTTVRDMDEFYSFLGKKRRGTKRRPHGSGGPLNPYSDMDPDIRAEIEKGDHGD